MIYDQCDHKKNLFEGNLCTFFVGSIWPILTKTTQIWALKKQSKKIVDWSCETNFPQWWWPLFVYVFVLDILIFGNFKKVNPESSSSVQKWDAPYQRCSLQLCGALQLPIRTPKSRHQRQILPVFLSMELWRVENDASSSFLNMIHQCQKQNICSNIQFIRDWSQSFSNSYQYHRMWI